MILNEALDLYLKTILPMKPRSIKPQTIQLNWWRGELGVLELSKITVKDIKIALHKLSTRLSNKGLPLTPATINRYIAVLSHLFSTAINDEWDSNLLISPFKRIRKLKEPRGRNRYLSADEIQTLFKTLKEFNHPYLYTIVMLLLSTGARRSEIVDLKWSDVDLTRRFILLTDTKNGSCRSLPISDKTLPLLANLNTKHNTYLFPNKLGKPMYITKAWEKVLRIADIKDFRMHDLRHSCASYLAMNGATVIDIATILGHKTLSMVQRYSHLNTGHITNVLNRMNDAVLK